MSDYKEFNENRRHDNEEGGEEGLSRASGTSRHPIEEDNITDRGYNQADNEWNKDDVHDDDDGGGVAVDQHESEPTCRYKGVEDAVGLDKFAEMTESKISTSASGSDPYTGGTDHGSGTIGGVGFGNKTAADEADIDTSDTRLDRATDTSVYSDATEYGSGTTAGPGAGNKMPPSGGDSKDSAVGKLMEKAGGILKNEGLEEKGREKREAKGFADEYD